MTFNTKSLPEAALDYAKSGFRVLPLYSIKNGKCTCGKNHPRPGKHPRTLRGWKDATTDLDTVRRWWEKWPNANIGMVTGELVVLDVDLPQPSPLSMLGLQAYFR